MQTSAGLGTRIMHLEKEGEGSPSHPETFYDVLLCDAALVGLV